MTAEDKDNLYVCINTSDMRVPDLIRDRAVCIKGGYWGSAGSDLRRKNI